MTKKDFQAIADVIKNLNLGQALATGYDIELARKVIVERFAEMLSKQNPRFNREYFRKACEPLF